MLPATLLLTSSPAWSEVNSSASAAPSKTVPVGALLRDDAALLDLIGRRSGEVLAADARIAQASADVGASRVLLPNPTADFAVGGFTLGRTNPASDATHVNGLGFSDTSNFNFGLSQTIELGKRGPRMEAADLRLKEANKSYAVTLADKLADARYALARVVYLKARLATLEEGLASAQKSDELQKSRLDHGGISGNDFDRLQLDTISLETDVARSRSEYIGALAACEGVLYARCDAGADDASALDAAAALPPTLPEPAASIASRPDIAVAHLEAAAAEQDAVLARRRGIPDPTVRLGYTHDNGQISGAQPNTLSLSVSVPLALFDHGQHDAAKATARAAEQRHLVTALSAGAQASYGALVDHRTFLEASLSRISAVAVPKSAGVLDTTQKAFGQGQVGMTDLLLARRTHLALILNQIDMRFDYFNVRNDLRRVLGLDATSIGQSR
jgi:cobalt-zinc-cadmium efflux system outer membrane protein